MLSFNEWLEKHPEIDQLDRQQQWMLYDEYLESFSVYAGQDPELD